MLSTPGRSPRLLPSPSPGGDGGRGKMGPPPPRQKGKRISQGVQVLDEDTYVEAIERIVQRDYFPDIPRLQDRLEWLEAIRTGDPEVIRTAQVRIMQRRADRRGGSGSTSGRATPSSTAGTPRSIAGTPGKPGSLLTPFSAVGTPGGLSSLGAADGINREAEAAQRARTNMSLDEFLYSHTSEDNASFSSIKEKGNKRRREKAADLLFLQPPQTGNSSSSGAAPSSSTALDRALVAPGGGTSGLLQESTEDRKTDGYGSTGQPTSTLQMWPYRVKNALMYDSSNREDAPLTMEELAERSMGPPKEVKYQNTRFRQSQTELQEQQARQSLEDTVAILYNPVPGDTPQRQVDPNSDRGSRKHYDLEDLRRTPVKRSQDSGAGVAGVGVDGKEKVYEYVATPTFTPGEGPDASPFMTWGDIDSTPLRLEAEDTPLGIGGKADGPQFKIPAAAAREELAVTMSRRAARNLKDRQRAMHGGPAAGAWASPGLGGSWSSPYRGSPAARQGMGTPMLSPAARKLAGLTAQKGKGGGAFDATLRASYAASPLRSPTAASAQHSAKKVLDSAVKESRARPRGGETAVSPAPSPLQR